MSAEVLNALYYGGLGTGIFFMVAAVVLFFVLRVWRVVGEITHVSASRGIKNLRSGRSAQSRITSAKITEKPPEQTSRRQSTGKLPPVSQGSTALMNDAKPFEFPPVVYEDIHFRPRPDQCVVVTHYLG